VLLKRLATSSEFCAWQNAATGKKVANCRNAESDEGIRDQSSTSIEIPFDIVLTSIRRPGEQSLVGYRDILSDLKSV